MIPRHCRAGVGGLLIALSACRPSSAADAYGNFEADETVVSAEVSGPLLRFTPTEGTHLSADSLIGLVDTLSMALERTQLTAQRAGLVARQSEAQAQLRGIEVQSDIARRTRARIERLFASQAATATQRDQVERDDRLLASQEAGARDGILRAHADIAALDARMASLADRVHRASVRNPIAGIVLATYARAGELIASGQPLYRIATLDTLTLRIYVTGAQLLAFRLGTTLSVHVDAVGDSLRTYPGTVSWIASKAEFTPTPIQTRDDRGDLVYAVKVRVANSDGALRIGMPGDATLLTPARAKRTVESRR
jgi:HlyD family secretion protein